MSLIGLKSSQRENLLFPPYALRRPMADEHSPLYKTIAEQVTAYIDLAVTEPMPGWGPSWTGEDDELPMGVLHDYDAQFPLYPAGLDLILGIPKTSDDHRVAYEQVMRDLLRPLNAGAVEYVIKELRLAYRSRKNSSIFMWNIRQPTPFVLNYALLARAEGALIRRERNPRTPPNLMVVGEIQPLSVPRRVVPGSAKENPLPSYIGGKVHARLVEVKAELNAIGFGHDLVLAQAS